MLTPPLIDLTRPEHAYFIGFVQGDGHLFQGRGRKGKLSIELAERDRWLLEQFAELFPTSSGIRSRTRDTNFKSNYESCELSFCQVEFRDALVEAGVPIGKKSECVAPPEVPFSQRDYFRGLVDADGSLGLEKNGLPFLSLTTSSDDMANAYQEYLASITGFRKQTNRNARDDVYNIMVLQEDARAVVGEMYYDGCLALPRKVEKARLINNWVRPDGKLKREPSRRWTSEEEAIVVRLRPSEAQALLPDRTLDSITIRRGRLLRASRKARSNNDEPLRGFTV